MKAAQKELVKRYIVDCNIKRFTLHESLQYVNQKGIKIGMFTLRKLKTDIKEEAREWITNLAKSRNDYIALYKEGIEKFQRLQDVCYDIIENPENPPVVKLIAVGKAMSIEREIIQLYDALPIVKALTEDKSDVNNNNGILQ
jgi:hypothetical protein